MIHKVVFPLILKRIRAIKSIFENIKKKQHKTVSLSKMLQGTKNQNGLDELALSY